MKQYIIREWWTGKDNLTGTSGKAIRVSVSLGRKLLNIVMVTYLPTILMNIINQATNYISDEDKFSLIYTINMYVSNINWIFYLREGVKVRKKVR